MAGETVVGTTPDGVVWLFFKEQQTDKWHGIGLAPRDAADIALALMEAANSIQEPLTPNQAN